MQMKYLLIILIFVTSFLNAQEIVFRESKDNSCTLEIGSVRATGVTTCDPIADGSIENFLPFLSFAGAQLDFPPYPTFQGAWSAVNLEGSAFREICVPPAAPECAYDGLVYYRALQNASQNPRTPWDESTHSGGGYDRAVTIVPVNPNTDYVLTFQHSSDDQFNYTAGNTLLQIQSMQTAYYQDEDWITPLTIFDYEEISYEFTTDGSTTSMALLFSSWGLNQSNPLQGTSVVIDYVCLSVGSAPSFDTTIINSFRADELRWTTKHFGGYMTGLYIWDDSRSYTWYSQEPTSPLKEADANAKLKFIKDYRRQCDQ